MNISYDIVIAGAGIVGLASAYQLLQRQPGLRIAMLEKEHEVAQHQTGHNSGVIHSGIYYKPGGSKALNCLRGYSMLLDFCTQHEVAHEVCGKVIVATSEIECIQLDGIFRRGLSNGLQGLEKLNREALLELEPHAGGLEAIRVPQAGIVDFPGMARKLAVLLQAAGVELFTGQALQAIHQRPGSVELVTGEQKLEAKLLITCAGLHADRLARMGGVDPKVRIIPFRGEYYLLAPEKQHLVKHLIYPVPDPAFPFLGVHYTRRIQGGIEAGPSAVLAFGREAYSRWNYHARDVKEMMAWPGFRKFLRKHWRTGLGELHRSFSKAAFARALQHLVPEVQEADLIRGGAGVRAMAIDEAGNMVDDFLFVQGQRQIHVCNAPSPAATASLSIGATVADKALHQLGLT